MAAAVAPALLPSLDLHDATAVARKRRREILTTQRLVSLPDVVDSVSLEEIRSNEPQPPLKIRRVSSTDDADSDSSSKSEEKKTQMKYDPPPNMQMSKEETAAWRREQRRKRNRESAAASRQRQRDRIVELEEELEQWKEKFASLAAKMKELEDAPTKTTEAVVSSDVVVKDLSVVSPSTSPRMAPCVSPVSCYEETGIVSPDGASNVKEETEEELSKLIPRQA